MGEATGVGTLTARQGRQPMNILLWRLQVLVAMLYGASGVMKAFMFDKVSHDVPSFGALPRRIWMALCVMELPDGSTTRFRARRQVIMLDPPSLPHREKSGRRV